VRSLFLITCLLLSVPCIAQEADESKVLTDADYTAHVEALRKRVPKEFTIVVQRPFVVLGDEPPSEVKRRALRTVKWSVDRLKALYFPKDPDHIIDIWLFKGKASYRANAKKYFNDEPETPYGYYSAADKALVMNIATGGGTLVHEIVHPFIHANFPDCPAWFNEGLASLYEQCGDKEGKLWGFTNWRLAGLQKALKKGTVPTFKALTATSSNAFYNQDKGTNYSQARYLCYYLQTKGKLQAFFKRFVETVGDDPTGYAALEAVLKTDDMAAFEKTWKAFVLGLRFR
jgi:hypothetical protein